MKQELKLVKAWNVATDGLGDCFDNLFWDKEGAITYACNLHARDRRNVTAIKEIWAVTDGRDLALCYGASEAGLEGICDSYEYDGDALSELELEAVRKLGRTINSELLEALPVDVDSLEAEAVYHCNGKYLSIKFGGYLSEEEEEEAGFEVEDLANLALHNFKEGEQFCGYCTLADIIEAFPCGISCAFNIC